MPGEATATALSIVIYDGHYDKVHYALAMAAAAAAIDRPVTLFFTMDACRALMVGPEDKPGWQKMPTTTDEPAPDMEARFAAEKIATFEELLESCTEMGVGIMVCEMGLKARGLSADGLREDIQIAPGGLVTLFSGAAKDGQLVFI